MGCSPLMPSVLRMWTKSPMPWLTEKSSQAKKRSSMINIAFRTFGVPNLGIASFEKIFLTHGYSKMGSYHFDAKKLDANWYGPTTEDLPRVFISELCVHELSENAQHIIKKYTSKIDVDPVEHWIYIMRKKLLIIYTVLCGNSPLWRITMRYWKKANMPLG